MIPRLETERLVLRGWSCEDFEPYARFMADAEVMRYLSGQPVARGDAWRSMAGVAGHWVLRGYGVWAVERKSDAAFIGRIGLQNPETWPGLELCWTLAKEYWGHGYATEAAHAAIDYGFLTQSVDRLISVIDPRNAASQAVATRLGETRGESIVIPYQGKSFSADIWSITRAEWQNRCTR